MGGYLVNQSYKNFTVFSTYKKSKYACNNVVWQYLDLSNINSIEYLVKQIKPDAIIHNAALADVDECEINKDYAYKINVESTDTLARIAYEQNIRLIYISTDMVYDGEKGDYKETDFVNPINYYGRTKVIAEEKIAQICSNYVIVRTALIYGKSLTKSLSFTDNILINVNNNKDITLFYDQFRTPVLVNDLADAILELVNHSFSGIVNIGGSERIDRYSFGKEIAKRFKFPLQKIIKDSMYNFITPAPRPCDVALNISKAQSLLVTKFYDYKAGITQMLDKIESTQFKHII